MIEEFKKLMGQYGLFVAKHPFVILVISLLITVVAVQLQSGLEIRSQNERDMLPEDREVIVAYTKISDEFGGLNTITVVIEVDPNVADSNEVRDSIDPRAIAYAWSLQEKILTIRDVASVRSAAGILRESNGGTLPKSIKRSKEIWDQNPGLNQYLSDDRTLLLIKAEILPDIDEDNMYEQIDAILKETDKPPGLKSYMIGEIAQSVELESLIGSDIQRTMSMSFIGILVVVMLVMGSIAYGILPLFTIIFGTTWSMGMWAGMGMSLTSNTSGVSSMIMGIGIDFGIQTISRFRQEFKRIGKPEEALAETLANVVLPMSTTTLSALIGFRAMSMGELTFLAEMADIMSLGVFASMMASITIVPSIMIIYVRHIRPHTQKIKLREVLKKWKTKIR